MWIEQPTEFLMCKSVQGVIRGIESTLVKADTLGTSLVSEIARVRNSGV